MGQVTRIELADMFRWRSEGRREWGAALSELQAWLPDAAPWPVVDGHVALAASELDGAFLREAGALTGVSPRVDPHARLGASRGMATADLVRARLGDTASAPQAVFEPASHDQVAALLSLCGRAGVAVVARGGGTSVTGAVTPPYGAVVLDLSARLHVVLAVSDRDGLVTAQAGILGPALERAAGLVGRTVGHFPQSFERSTLGGWIAARSVGQLSSRYGRADEMVVGLRAVSAVGELVVPPRPASAVGPDPIQLLAGSEGGLAVITEATVRALRAHGGRYLSAWLLPDFAAGLGLLRELAADGSPPAGVRLSDADETELTLRAAGLPSVLQPVLHLVSRRRMALLIVTADGPPDLLRAAGRHVRRAAFHARALPLGSAPARLWWRDRFRQPGLRDLLLDRGILADTWETAAPWSALERVHDRVREAVRALRGRVLAHVSHVYPEGAAIYFTVLLAAGPSEALARLDAARRAVVGAFADEGLPLSHQHGAGRVLAGEARAGLGAAGALALSGLKRALDPAGILNPGLMLDPR